MILRAASMTLLLSTFGCGATVTASASDASTADEPLATTDLPAVDLPAVDLPAVDGPIAPGECRLPSDCGPPTMSSVTACSESSAWSCIDRQCVWECRGGRRCDRAPDGCVSCDGVMRAYCPGRDACPPGWPDAGQLEESTCARAWTREPSECFGPWVRMTSDGTLCSLQSLFTGAPRSVLSCRRCQTALLGVEP